MRIQILSATPPPRKGEAIWDTFDSSQPPRRGEPDEVSPDHLRRNDTPSPRCAGRGSRCGPSPADLRALALDDLARDPPQPLPRRRLPRPSRPRTARAGGARARGATPASAPSSGRSWSATWHSTGAPSRSPASCARRACCASATRRSTCTCGATRPPAGSCGGTCARPARSGASATAPTTHAAGWPVNATSPSGRRGRGAGSSVGHWEIDTVMGDEHGAQQRGHDGRARDRLHGDGQARRGTAPADATARCIELIARHAGRVATITADNGTEFHSYADIEAATGVAVLLRHPAPLLGARHQREHQRADPPVPAEAHEHGARHPADCDAIAAKLNSRPRKRLGYRTPEECYAKAR